MDNNETMFLAMIAITFVPLFILLIYLWWEQGKW